MSLSWGISTDPLSSIGNQQVPGGSAELNLKTVAVAEPPCAPVACYEGCRTMSTVYGVCRLSSKLTDFNPSH